MPLAHFWTAKTRSFCALNIISMILAVAFAVSYICITKFEWDADVVHLPIPILVLLFTSQSLIVITLSIWIYIFHSGWFTNFDPKDYDDVQGTKFEFQEGAYHGCRAIFWLLAPEILLLFATILIIIKCRPITDIVEPYTEIFMVTSLSVIIFSLLALIVFGFMGLYLLISWCCSCCEHHEERDEVADVAVTQPQLEIPLTTNDNAYATQPQVEIPLTTNDSVYTEYMSQTLST